ncbi:MAG: VanZ family protein [Deltaproteobacteria bacterium]
MSPFTKRWRLWAWFVVGGYAALIFYLSTQSNPLPALTAHVWDKLLHLTEYGGLGFCLALALTPRFQGRDLLAWVALLGLLYGASDELHQSFVPGRDAELGDVLADGIGSALGAASVLCGSFWFHHRTGGALSSRDSTSESA